MTLLTAANLRALPMLGTTTYRWRQDEPEGQVSARRTLTAIAETFAVECSICRRRHGSEVRHAAE